MVLASRAVTCPARSRERSSVGVLAGTFAWAVFGTDAGCTLKAETEIQSQRGKDRRKREEPVGALWMGNDCVILHEF